jgi:hypothetical protein
MTDPFLNALLEYNRSRIVAQNKSSFSKQKRGVQGRHVADMELKLSLCCSVAFCGVAKFFPGEFLL